MATGQVIRSLRGHAAEVWDVTYSPDGQQLASVGTDGAVKVWDLSPTASKAPELRVRLPLGFSAEGNMMVFTTNAFDARVAWSAPHPKKDRVRVFEQAWENPRPEVAIATLDFVSTRSRTSPLLIAISAEPLSPPAPAKLASAVRK